MSKPIVVWTEIPVTDLKKAADFYAAVFGWKMEITQMGPIETAMFNSVSDDASGHLYAGTPGAGPTVHIRLPDTIEAGSDRCTAAGGKIIGDPVTLPDGARFQYATDLDGNSIGLFEGVAA